MNTFSIAQLSRFTGIKPHTIRMWEQRYGALSPGRSSGNTRHYDGDQLRRLLNIVSLLSAGQKVSEVCSFSDEELYREIQAINPSGDPETNAQIQLHELIARALRFDAEGFERIFNHCILKYGMRNAYVQVIYPLLQRLGLLWSENEIPPAQEHFVTNIIRQKIFTAIDGVSPVRNRNETWVLFTPEDEFHELGLLFSSLLIRLSGRKVVYLGPNVPLASVKDTVKQTGSNKLLLFLVHKHTREELIRYTDLLSHSFRDKSIYIACGMDNRVEKVKKNIFYFHSVQELEQELL